MGEHTPGPWKASPLEGPYPICVVEHENHHLTWFVNSEGNRAFPEDDACLIAAAPDLLAALEGLVDSDFVNGAPPWVFRSQLTGNWLCECCERVIDAESGWDMGHNEECLVHDAFIAIAKARRES